MGGERKISLEIKQKNSILSQIKKSFDFKNLIFRYSLKFAFAVSLGVFIALYFNVDHGFWIALGVMTVMRFSVDDIKNATKDTIIATIIGMVIGVGLLLLFGVSLMFYVIGFIMLFLVFYIKPFNFFFWMISFIILLTMYFALVSGDYEGLMLLRFEDMAVGFLISIIISSIFWKHRLKDEIRPIIDKILINFSNLLETIINKNLDKFTNNQSLLLLNLKDYKNSIKSTKSKIFDDILCEFERIDVMILNLKTYLQKHDFDDEFVNNDLLAIKSRFDMLKSLNDDLPSYFFSDFMNNDKQLLAMMDEITNYQESLYNYLDDAKNTKIW